MEIVAKFFENYPDVKLACRIAKSHKAEIYLVGGFVRDYLLNRARKDFDFAVSKNALKIARRFARRIHGAFVLLDKERGCARVVKKRRQDILTFDFADFRDKTLAGDLSHRDFTINALCLNMNRLTNAGRLSDVLVDSRYGLRDLKSKKIAMVSKDAFKEDPLRLIRAFSLRAQLAFEIDRRTLAQIKKDKSLIKKVSGERIRD